MSHFTHGEKGFRITFDNGYTLSVQYGLGNYCDRQDYGQFNEPSDPSKIESSTCEIAVWDKDLEWVRLSEHDDVAGWIPAQTIPQIMVCVQDEDWRVLRQLCTKPS
jgi:hypothetical protein